MATFHPFLRLAPELRFAIWEAAIEPRDVRLLRSTSEDPTLAMTFSWKSSAKTPAVMHVCRQAREHFKKHYVKAKFSSEDSGRYVWFHPSVDSLRINAAEVGFIVNSQESHLIQDLILDVTDSSNHLIYGKALSLIRRLDKTLKRLTLLHLEHEFYWAQCRPVNEEPDEFWMDDLFAAFAILYWQCNAAPFHTRAMNPALPHIEEVTSENYVRYVRQRHIEELREKGDNYGDPEWREAYINDADEYWQPWDHIECDCEDKEENLGQQLVDAAIKEYPIDVASLVSSPRL